MAGQTDMELIKNGVRLDGRKPDELLKGSFTWEKTDLVEILNKEL